MMKNIFVIIFIALILSTKSYSQENITIERTEIDKYISKIKDSLNIPGISVGISIDSEVRYTNTFGYANLETKTKLTSNSIWHICSVSKQFSTIACLKLAEEKKISLNDKISVYFENLPTEYSDITISNLLSNTSGIKDYINDRDLYGIPWEKVENVIFSDSLNFRPGSAWSYSNTGFWIIAKIIEKVTKMAYIQYLEHNFLIKLGMDQTQKLTGEKIIEQRVDGYTYYNSEYCNSKFDINKFYGQGDGDLMSDMNDLLNWSIALSNCIIITKESLSVIWTPTKQIDGKTLEVIPNSGLNYGKGWFISEINGHKIVWTPGAGFGFSTSSMHIPDYKMCIVVLCNKEQFLMANDIGILIAKKILPEFN